MNSRNVAVIIPVYISTDEQLGWLDECLASIADQNCIISLHDDGSVIDIGNVVSKYNITHYSRAEHVGVSHARNEAVSKIPDNSLIFPLDCDDTIKPRTIERLASLWEGVPIYPDVEKFGDEIVPHYVLMEWDCSHLYNFVGFTSVNVLHSKEQWKSIGGWDATLDFYEDGEYNARLFGNFCGRRFPEPLVNYRMHHGQRTKQYAGKSRYYANLILEKVRRYEFMCSGCGGKRRSGNQAQKSASGGAMSQISGTRGENIMVDNANLPISFEGKVLARYEGGRGKGKHYYQGIGSLSYYKNIQYGDLVYADPRDARSISDTGSTSRLIRVERSSAAPIAAPKPAPVQVTNVTNVSEPIKTPKLEVAKEPVAPEVEAVAEVGEGEMVAFEDISKIGLKDIKKLDISCEDAIELIKIEETGANRPNVVKYLNSLCSE